MQPFRYTLSPRQALESLGKIGYVDSMAIAELFAQLHSNIDPVCIRAARSSIYFQKNSPELVTELISLLKNKSWYIRENIAGSLKELSKSDSNILLQLLQWIEQQPEDQPIGEAIDALWSIVVE